MLGYTITSSCPKCGAPIFIPEIHIGLGLPPPMFTCECRKKQEHSEILLLEIKQLISELLKTNNTK